MDQIEGTRLAADTCRMAKKPNRRNLKQYKLPPEAVRLGTAEAAGIEKRCRLIGCRKGEITREDLSGNGLGQFCAARVLSATPLMYSMQRDYSNFVVFCFSNSEDAEGFAKRFGEPIGRATLKASGDDLIT